MKTFFVFFMMGLMLIVGLKAISTTEASASEYATQSDATLTAAGIEYDEKGHLKF